MRRASRTIPFGKQPYLQISQVPYVCSSCRHQAQRQHPSRQQAIRNASSGLPFTERLRRRMWGTDSPPGLEDPYGGPSYFEKRRQERQGVDQSPEPTAEELAVSESQGVAPAAQKPRLRRKRDATPETVWGSVYMHDPVRYDPDYVPAETWDGLPRISATPRSSDRPAEAVRSFQP